ncbi:BTAD domain-containing putative transcriptional regulator [Streptomyces sp. NBC_01803]|uniref:BTAD domain-containing putative transcriptional regulator n=1 Tax=Streptomyces sp. NBC_01803 TaxID=2975946 RepID=UPI002DDA1E1D|nr:BTAD domain-containing putative transcriptional regulator [Streptomyces sp. NBC_01803]WSA44204.1 LysM peptidoglycan-binding domain-containing protein [Streptomyces sp. NBC_01803]
MTGRSSRLSAHSTVSAVIAFLALAAVLVGVPLVLTAAVGRPWPDPTTSLQDLAGRLRQPLGDRLVLQLFALAGWLCWAAFATATLREAAWYLRNLPRMRTDRTLHAVHLEALPAPRLVIAACIGSVVLTLLAWLRPPLADAAPATNPHPATQLLQVPAPHADVTAPAAGAEEPGGHAASYTVQPGDTLWDIADRCLGDPIRWPQIYALSSSIRQPDGHHLTDPDQLRPGWTLHLPISASHRQSATPLPGPERPQPTEGPTERPAPQEEDPSRAPAPSEQETQHDSTAKEAGEADAERPSAPATARPVHVSVGFASIIGITTAAGIAAAVAASRARARRRSPGPTTEPPNLAQAVRSATQATLAALRAEQDEAEARDADITRRPAPAHPARPGTVTFAQRDDAELTINTLASPGGWNLTGPGALPAARALAMATLSAAQRLAPDPPQARLVIPRPLVSVLLPELSENVPAWTPVVDTAHALRTVQAARLECARRREADQPGTGSHTPLIIVLTDEVPPPHLTPLTDHAGADELVVIGVGTQAFANTVHLDTDGTVLHTTGPHQHALEGAAAFLLAPEPARELLTCLNAVHPASGPEPAAELPPPQGPTEAPPRPSTATREPPLPPPTHLESPDLVPEATAKAPLTLLLFGGLSLHTPRGEFPLAMKEAAKEFLALLAAHPKGLRTETITDALRLSHDPERATRDLVNLRRAVRRTLRHATGSHSAAFILQTAGRHRLDPQLINTDVDAFSTAIGKAAGNRDAHARARYLRAALAGYQGPLCEGADYPWADELREYFHHKAIDAAILLADHTTAAQPQEALALLERAVTWEPTNEPVCQRLMRLYHDIGQPEAAQHVYQRLLRHLTEIDVTPTETTRALATPNGGHRTLRTPRAAGAAAGA